MRTHITHCTRTASPAQAYRVVFTALTAGLLSCLSLDPFYFKDERTDSYQLDSFSEFRECADAIDSIVALHGPLDPALVHYVTFASGNETIWSILLHTDSVCTPQDTLILYFYGRTRNIDFYWPRTRLLHETGYPVLVVDFPGYGKSTGDPSEQALVSSGIAAFNTIRTRLGDPAVIVYGYSTGTWVACELAATDTSGRIARFILEAPMGSIETLVQDAVYIDIPGSYASTIEGNNLERIRNVTIPLLWLHGLDDGTLRYETQGVPVWEHYPGPEGCYIAVAGSDHTEVPTVIGYGRYINCIRMFIQGAYSDPLFHCK